MQHKVVTPPQAIEAEEAIIGCILLNPSKFKETSGYIIEDDVFYDDRNKLLWKSIKEMISKGAKIDQTTVISHLTQRERDMGVTPYYVTGITTNALEQDNLEAYAQIIYRKYLLEK